MDSQSTFKLIFQIYLDATTLAAPPPFLNAKNSLKKKKTEATNVSQIKLKYPRRASLQYHLQAQLSSVRFCLVFIRQGYMTHEPLASRTPGAASG